MIAPESMYEETIRYLAKAELAIQEGNEGEAGLYVQMADVLSRLVGIRPGRRGPGPAGPGVRPVRQGGMVQGVAGSMTPPEGPTKKAAAGRVPRTRIEEAAELIKPPSDQPAEGQGD